MVKKSKDAKYKTDDKKPPHIVEIEFNGEVRSIRVFSARAARSLVEMVKAYPDGITKKEMDVITGGELHDNKMFDELKTESCLSEYVITCGRRGSVDIRKIDLEKLWKNTEDLLQPIWFGIEDQIQLSQFESKLIEKYGFKCNITGIHLLKDPPKHTFAERLRVKAIDHRRPKLKQGKTEFDNLQILSHYVNERKKQICSICTEPKCEKCALAYPENTTIVYPTGDEISELMKWKKTP